MFEFTAHYLGNGGKALNCLKKKRERRKKATKSEEMTVNCVDFVFWVIEQKLYYNGVICRRVHVYVLLVGGVVSDRGSITDTLHRLILLKT